MPDGSVPAGIRDLGDRIVGLTLLEARSLRDYLRAVHGFDATLTPTAAPRDPTGATPGEGGGATRFDVVLEEAGDQPIGTIRIVRAVTGLGLAECKRLVEDLPQVVARDLNEAAAGRLQRELASVGATARIE